MARPPHSHIQHALTRLLPRRRVRHLAAQLGVVRRIRKLDVVALVYSLVLGFAAGDRRTLTGMRRAYLRATGVRLAPSSFYARFNDALSTLMRTLALDALEQLAASRPKLRAVFAPFREVLAVDSALLRLHNALEPFYPSVFRHYMKASIKLGMVMNVIGRGAKTVALSAGSRHDTHLLQVGPWMKGRLLLFDLGFFGAALFTGIAAHGGYFLCRMRKHGNPVIVRAHERKHQHLVGAKLHDALKLVDGLLLDVDAEMVYQRKHRQRPFVTTHHATFRFVALYNEEFAQWHGYVTNLPPSAMHGRHFAAVYAARWEVELLFRELKTRYRLDDMPSANRHVAETLIYASLLTLAVSRRLYRLLITRWKSNTQRIPIDRWAALVATIADELLVLMLDRYDRIGRECRIEHFLRTEALDPNAARIPLAYRAQLGTYSRA